MARQDDEAQLNTNIDSRLKLKLQKRLLDDGLTIRAWIEQQIRAYVKSGIDKEKKRVIKRKRASAERHPDEE